MLKIKNQIPYVLLVGLLALTGCSLDAEEPIVTPPTDDHNNTTLFKIETLLDSNDATLVNWLDRVRGSVGKRGPGSKTVWSRKNDFELGLYVSANHVMSLTTWESREEKFINIRDGQKGIFETSKLPPADGSRLLGDQLIADFPLYHPAIPEQATNTTILPADDFYLGILDNQRVTQQQFAQTPGPVQTETPLDMYDPDGRTTADTTWAAAVPGENVMMIGYPQNVTDYPNGAASLGKVLSDQEAATKINELRSAGDPEGDIPYQPNAELLVSGTALAGMSGGGVFNTSGQLVGIMVRASDKEGAPNIVRAVRISYVRKKLSDYFETLSDEQKDRVRPFISGEL